MLFDDTEDDVRLGFEYLPLESWRLREPRPSYSFWTPHPFRHVGGGRYLGFYESGICSHDLERVVGYLNVDGTREFLTWSFAACDHGAHQRVVSTGPEQVVKTAVWGTR